MDISYLKLKLMSVTVVSICPWVTHADSIQLDSVEVQGTSYKNSYTERQTDAATGLSLSLKETPQSVSVITQQRIEDQNLDNVKQILEQTIGIYQKHLGSNMAGYSYVYARGFEVGNYSVDGAAIKTTSMGKNDANMQGVANLNSIIYDNVTVIRGATGLLNGIGDPSAAVSLSRKKPTADNQVEINLAIANWKRVTSSFDVTGSLNQDLSLRSRVIASYARGNSWQSRVSNNQGLLYGILEYDITADTMITTVLELQRAHEKGGSILGFQVKNEAGQYTQFDHHANATADWSFYKQNRLNFFTSLQHDWDSDWQLKLDYGFTNSSTEQLFGVAAQGIAVNNSSGLTRSYSKSTPKQHNLSINLKGHYPLFARQHELFTGLSYHIRKQNNPIYMHQFIGSPINNVYQFTGNYPYFDYTILNPINNNGVDNVKQLAAYVSTRLHPTDNLSLILGSRINSWKTETSELIPPPPHWRLNKTDESFIFTPYLGVVYNINNELSIYGNFTTIYKPQTLIDSTGNYLKPETGHTIEAGIKAELLDKKLNTHLALFQTKKNNLALFINAGGGIPYYRAEDKAKAQGLELEISGAITPHWNIQAGYNYTRIKDKNGLRIQKQLPLSQFKLFTTYTLPIKNTALMFGGGLRWQSKLSDSMMTRVFRPGPPAMYSINDSQHSYAIVDLVSTWKINANAEVNIQLENLFNKQYRTHVLYHSYGAPRNVSLGFKYKF